MSYNMHFLSQEALPRITFRKRAEYENKLRKVTVYNYSGKEPMDFRTREYMFYLALYPMYDENWEKKSDLFLPDTLSSVLTTLLVYTDYKTLKAAGLEEALNTCNFSLDVVNFKTSEEAEKKCWEIQNSVKPLISFCNSYYQAYEIHSLSLFILLFWNSTCYIHQLLASFDRLWQNIGHLLNVTMNRFDKTRPTEFSCKSLRKVAMNNQHLRMFLLKVIQSLSEGHKDPASPAFNYMLKKANEYYLSSSIF